MKMCVLAAFDQIFSFWRNPNDSSLTTNRHKSNKICRRLEQRKKKKTDEARGQEEAAHVRHDVCFCLPLLTFRLSQPHTHTHLEIRFQKTEEERNLGKGPAFSVVEYCAIRVRRQDCSEAELQADLGTKSI